MNNNVFVSYASDDSLVARTLCNSLEHAGFSAWIAERDIEPGSGWSGRIVEAIKKSDFLVLVFSQPANCSVHVLREVELAFSSRLAIVTYRIDPVDPNTDLRYFLSGDHRLDAFDKVSLSSQQKLIAALRRLQDGVRIEMPGKLQVGELKKELEPATLDLRLKLIDTALEQNSTNIRIDHLWHAHKDAFMELLHRQVILHFPVADKSSAAIERISFASTNQFQEAFSDWAVLHQPDVTDMIEHSIQFAELADGIALHICRFWRTQGKLWFERVVNTGSPVVERIVTAVLLRLGAMGTGRLPIGWGLTPWRPS